MAGTIHKACVPVQLFGRSVRWFTTNHLARCHLSACKRWPSALPLLQNPAEPARDQEKQMKTLIAAVALAISLIAVPAFIQAAESDSSGRVMADRNSRVAQYCIPQEDDSVTMQKIYCRGPA
jgi:hypothetical protein